MNCQNHPETAATAFCRSCGKALCDACRRDAYGTVFCEEHQPAPSPPPPQPAAAPPYAAPSSYPPPGNGISPGLALALGLIVPGVGAIYNGQYAKGLVHAVIFGLLISILESGAGGLAPLVALLLTAWIFYMGFEAYHTAVKRRRGEPVDEFSSLVNVREQSNQLPVAGLALIVLGSLLLLNTLDLVDFRYLVRYWPLLLIGAGAWLLYLRLSAPVPNEEARHER
jgi:hypothetical protein